MEFILDTLARVSSSQQAAEQHLDRFERRMDQFERRMDRFEPRMDRFEKILSALKKLVQRGMKVLVQIERRHEELAAEVKVLAKAQQKTEQTLQRFRRSTGNGGNGRRT